MTKLITVITPTYNRGKNLEALFKSLQNQTSFNFEWLIVDDGSQDDTKEIVKEFIKCSNFQIRYIYKENGGKHTALNAGIKTICTELTFIVDSDDTLMPTSVEIIESFYNKYKCDYRIGVLSFLKRSEKNGVILKMPQDECIGSYAEERIKADRPGDMAEVFLTKALREFPFPEFEGEKFLSEDVVWIPMGLKYKTVFINQAIYQFDYLPDGLTRNDKLHKFASPFGSMLRGKILMKKECGLKANIKGAIIYNCYKCEAKSKNKEIPENLKIKTAKERILAVLTLFFGKIYNVKCKANIK